jgi:hypothetical protein
LAARSCARGRPGQVAPPGGGCNASPQEVLTMVDGWPLFFGWVEFLAFVLVVAYFVLWRSR